MYKETCNFSIHNGTRRITFNFTKKLPLADIHTPCPYCNYMGCCSSNYSKHLKFTISLLVSTIKTKIRKIIYDLGQLDYSKIDDIEVDGIDTRDYPDFCDAYIAYATYKGKPMSESQLERLNQDSDFVYQCVTNKLY